MPPTEVLRVANCSGFYGDRLSAAREIVEGGPIDVLTGDWLAELTMLLLGKAVLAGRPGYARTFLTQVEQVLPTCLERGIKIVSNAGGLDPAGCAAAVTELARRAGLSPVVAYVDGDDLTRRVPELLADGHKLANLDTGEPLAGAGVTPLTAHAYLGGLPIARALAAGADVVVTGRVTDAALVVGPGIWWFGWDGANLDALAGAVVAGHVLECGCQATGGNYPFVSEVADLAHAGFPLAELARDGSAIITKHPGTGGLVSVGTVTAQLLYEIGGPAYVNPDVTARFDTIALEQVGPDRVRISGVRGEPPPADLKVAMNYAGGYRNSMILAIEGLDVAAKAKLAQEAIWARIDGGRDSFDVVDVDLVGTGTASADTAGPALAETSSGTTVPADPSPASPSPASPSPASPSPASPATVGPASAGPALLRITVLDRDKAKVGRAFSAAVVETALASYPGFYALTPPGDGSSFGVYWPTLVPAELVRARVVVDGAEVWAGPARIEPTPRSRAEPTTTRTDSPQARPGLAGPPSQQYGALTAAGATVRAPYRGRATADSEKKAPYCGRATADSASSVRRAPLGTIAGARSGDKGGNANVGVWVRTAEQFKWLDDYLTADRLAELVPSTAGLPVERHRLPNLLALNFVVVGLLGRGVAASTRLDPQAKALGEELRAAIAPIPADVLFKTR